MSTTNRQQYEAEGQAIADGERSYASSILGDEAPERIRTITKFEEVLQEVTEGDERERATHAATVLMHRVPGYRPSDAAREIVRRWKAGRLDTWDDIRRDANPGPLEPYTDAELRSFRA